MIEDTLTISALITYINSRLYNDSNLLNVRVTGELGNFSSYKGSGHWYFTLKDATASIRCAMFRGYNSTVDFMPKEGEMLVATGNINIYESRGELQLIVTLLQQAGQGNFYVQFEKIKAKLAPLGYFDESRKKPIKQFPEQISVVTGANTAALQDIRITIAKRWPAVRVLEVYAIVQGKEAIKSVTDALKTADSQGSDTIILARGGGSVDDLWCFNDESIAKTIFECKTPVITGIGHEIDFTIADLVADARAATPTAAAQRATPDQTEVRNAISSHLSIMKTVMDRKLQNKMQSLDIAESMLERFRLNVSNTVTSLRRYRSIIYLSLTKLIENQNIRIEHCLETLNSS
ncbi:MAG: exodeoxyribonuclease VII large subunit, partial [Erysipelotrichaceae bacterium]|nr:exodeoxyribonuclease VII large subunit [Erysipelotrichaceae bacterium]